MGGSPELTIMGASSLLLEEVEVDDVRDVVVFV